ncbi:MAG: protein kinase [candidate division Zixibacteria bacterium]|nr:protein kinase [candidate division Zixibacteria bacterium]
MILKAEQIFAHFKILRQIGEGGMGEVYLAEDLKLNRRVALKILQAEFFDNPDRLERFRREAKTAASISHPNVMAIYDMDTARDEESGRDLNYIVMEYIKGESLTDYLQKKSLNTSGVLRIAEKIASGLAAAHKLKIVHRDIKPDNIRVNEEGDPKILDFGLAKPIDLLGSAEDKDTTDTISKELTQEGKIIGTVNYMSPEQARGEAVDTRSDIFAYGIVLYRMLTGEFPFDGKDKVSVIAKILEGRHVPIRQKNESLPPELERIIDKCLQKSPDDRYQDTRDLVVDIRSLRRQYESGISDTTSIISDKTPAASRTFTFSGKKLLYTFGFLIILVAFAALWGDVFFKGKPAGGPALQARENALAILGFENKTGDPELDWLQAGLPEILLTDLAQSGAGNIISRNRILDCLEGEDAPLAGFPSHKVCIDAARTLGASTALSGSFYKLGDKIRIDARLEDIETGKIILGEKVMGEDPFILVDSLTHKIAQSLNIQLAMADRKDVTTYTSSSPEAYKYYILGMEKFGLNLFDEAIDNFKKAIEIDSTFALPYMRIGMAYTFMGRDQPGIMYFIKAKQYEDKLPIKEKNLLDIYTDTWLESKFDDAYIKLKTFVNNYPDDKEARTIYALFLSELANNKTEAIAQLDTVLILDQKNPLALQHIGRIYAVQGDYDKAIEYADLFKKHYPESPIAYELLSAYYQDIGQYDKAEKESQELLKMSPTNQDALRLLVRIDILLRNFESAEKYAEMIRENYANDPYNMIIYYGFKENLAYWRGQFKKAGDFQRGAIDEARKTGDSVQIYNQMSGLASYLEDIAGQTDSALALERNAYKWAQKFQPINHAFKMVQFDVTTAPEVKQMFYDKVQEFKASLPKEMWSLIDNLSVMFEGLLNRDTAKVITAYEEMMKNPNQVSSGDKFEYGKLLVLNGQYEKGIEILNKMTSGIDVTDRALRYLKSRYYIGRAEESLGHTDRAAENYREVLKYWGKPDIELEEIADTRIRLNRLQG